MFELDKIVRKNVSQLSPYSSARDEFSGKEGVFLDANENSIGSLAGDGHNRYPDPLQMELKQKIAKLKNVKTENIFVGNGSDEAIDLIFRAFCNPGTDNAIILPPTYGMYEVSAEINDISLTKVELTKDFEPDVPAILSSIKKNTKLIFVCSPNNPTGNAFSRESVKSLTNKFNGIIVIDEAYIDFSDKPGYISELEKHPNIIIIQTFSKAWGMAGLRVGMAFASKQIIDILNKIKPPYNVNGLCQSVVSNALSTNQELAKKWIDIIKTEKTLLIKALSELPFISKIYPSDANFILVKTTDANDIYRFLIEKNIVIRNRSKVSLCNNCLRITVGKKEENIVLINALKSYQ